ncbi:NUDIX hydrolase [Strigomonas culicis]|uniref:NUDIX hydrolase n=1 Tax=Strigomonas culicis TaxID=28005 RepID=S9U2A3_9TRYP|nr:NUDIX hydrolase [Strigomonas culicis]|eukprot:EPY24922.1 NUDIX hydrolase [Strigomonas culicis]
MLNHLAHRPLLRGAAHQRRDTPTGKRGVHVLVAPPPQHRRQPLRRGPQVQQRRVVIAVRDLDVPHVLALPPHNRRDALVRVDVRRARRRDAPPRGGDLRERRQRRERAQEKERRRRQHEGLGGVLVLPQRVHRPHPRQPVHLVRLLRHAHLLRRRAARRRLHNRRVEVRLVAVPHRRRRRPVAERPQRGGCLRRVGRGAGRPRRAEGLGGLQREVRPQHERRLLRGLAQRGEPRRALGHLDHLRAAAELAAREGEVLVLQTAAGEGVHVRHHARLGVAPHQEHLDVVRRGAGGRARGRLARAQAVAGQQHQRRGLAGRRHRWGRVHDAE